jgi:hypothetical protein
MGMSSRSGPTVLGELPRSSGANSGERTHPDPSRRAPGRDDLAGTHALLQLATTLRTERD